MLRVRSVTQAYNELFELSEEDAREVQRSFFRPAKARPVGALTIDPENPPISGPAKSEDAVEQLDQEAPDEQRNEPMKAAKKKKLKAQ